LLYTLAVGNSGLIGFLEGVPADECMKTTEIWTLLRAAVRDEDVHGQQVEAPKEMVTS
jgi:hypothetical protein